MSSKLKLPAGVKYKSVHRLTVTGVRKKDRATLNAIFSAGYTVRETRRGQYRFLFVAEKKVPISATKAKGPKQ